MYGVWRIRLVLVEPGTIPVMKLVAVGLWLLTFVAFVIWPTRENALITIAVGIIVVKLLLSPVKTEE